MWKISLTRLLKLRTEPVKEDADQVESRRLLQNGTAKQKTLVRKISRSQSQEKESGSGDEAQEDGTDQRKGKVAQVSSSGDSFKQKAASKKNGGDLKPRHARFGPYYDKKDDKSMSMEEAKNRSLAKALGITDLDQKDDQSKEMKKSYEDAMKEIEIKAREQYADDLEGVTVRTFRDMMMKDGCFFLQLALLILGHEKGLNYPSEDAIFGESRNETDIRVWIESMFFVGNQIPFIVLHTLMANQFFKVVLQHVRRSPPPTSGFCKKVLYNLLTECYKPADGPEEDDDKKLPPSSDCLHALHDLILGPGPSNWKTSGIYQKDLEANNEFMDEKITDPYGLEDGSQSTNPAMNDEKRRMFPSATQLYGSFIFIRKLKNGDGVRRIRFKSYYICAFLDLPEFPDVNEAGSILWNLTAYEASQKLVGNGGEVTSYIRMMSDIVQTAKDVQYLQKKKILQYPKDDVLYEDKLPQMLEKMSNQEATLTYDFLILKHKIADYSGPPWTRIKSILNLVALLTLLQTVFTMLAYLHPQPQPQP